MTKKTTVVFSILGLLLIYGLLEYGLNYAMYLDLNSGKTRTDIQFFRLTVCSGSPQETPFSQMLAQTGLTRSEANWVQDGTFQVWSDGIIRPREHKTAWPRCSEIHGCATFINACAACLQDFDGKKKEDVLSWELNRLKNFEKEKENWPKPYDCETDGLGKNLDRILQNAPKQTEISLP